MFPELIPTTPPPITPTPTEPIVPVTPEHLSTPAPEHTDPPTSASGRTTAGEAEQPSYPAGKQNNTKIQNQIQPGQMHQTVSEYRTGNIKKMVVIILLIVVALVALGLAGWIWWNKRTVNTSPVNGGKTSTPIVDQVQPDPFPDDLDRDGISNEEEIKLGTSNADFDTDGDGLSDLDEINTWHTSPTTTDSDGDGFSDGWEVMGGYNPAGTGKLDR